MGSLTENVQWRMIVITSGRQTKSETTAGSANASPDSSEFGPAGEFLRILLQAVIPTLYLTEFLCLAMKKAASMLAVILLTMFLEVSYDESNRTSEPAEKLKHAESQSYERTLTSQTLALEETDQAVTIRQSGNTMLVYNKQAPQVPDGIDPVFARTGFLHPVASPSGRIVTDVYPFDHAHQSGIFAAWVRTKWNDREIDFWNLAGGTGRVLHQRVIRTFSTNASLGFETDLIHRAEKSPVVDILRERWKLTAFVTDGSYHVFDIETTQTALTDKPLVVQKYHYGGMAFRGQTRWLTDNDDDAKKNIDATNEAASKRLREPNSFLNDLGSDRIKGNHEHARWVSFTGQIDGQPVTITILSHRDNFRSPQPARIHPTKPYFVFSPCVDDEFVIDGDHPFFSRYRFIITDARADAAWLNEQWEAWCAM